MSEERVHFPRLMPEVAYRKRLREINDDIRAGGPKDALFELSRAIRPPKNARVVCDVPIKCPALDCRGFLNTKYRCQLCSSPICKKCMAVATDGHQCDPADVEIVKTTHPCPKCFVRIMKSSGCDQMFCTQCQTAFSWDSGKILKTNMIHNPHYFELQARGLIRPRERQECERIIPAEDMHHLVQGHARCMETLRCVTHYMTDTLPKMTERLRADAEDDRVRIKFLLGQYDEQEFSRRIYIKRQSRARIAEERQVMQMYTEASADLCNAISFDTIETFLAQYDELCAITKRALTVIKNNYQFVGFYDLPFRR